MIVRPFSSMCLAHIPSSILRAAAAEKLSAIAERLSALVFDDTLDFLARQVHDNTINLAVVFGFVITGECSDDFITFPTAT